MSEVDLENTIQDKLGHLIQCSAEITEHNDSDHILIHYAEHLEQLISLLGDADGYAGLQDICVLLQMDVQSLADTEYTITNKELLWLENIPVLLMEYIYDKKNKLTSNALISHLQSVACTWREPFTDEDLTTFKLLLQENNTDSDAQNETHLTEPVILDKQDFLSNSEEGLKQDNALLQASSSIMDDAPAGINALPPEISKIQINQEMVEMLASELALMAEFLTDTLQSTRRPDQTKQALEEYAEQLERMADASEAVELQALQYVFHHLHDNVVTLALSDKPFEDFHFDLLNNCLVPIVAYLQSVNDRSNCLALIEYLQNPHWPQPILAEHSENLIQHLTAPILTSQSLDDIEPRQEHVSKDDVSLVLPEDVNPELLDGLLQELPLQTENFSAAIQRLSEGGTQKDLEIAQRMAHTIKGAANTVGVQGLAILTHHVEDILLALTKQSALPAKILSETLINAADTLEAMSESLLGTSAPPAQSESIIVLQQVLDWANLIDKNGLPDETDKTIQLHQKDKSQPPASETADKEATQKDAEPTPTGAAATAMLRVPATLIDHLLRLVGETMITTAQVQERLNKVLKQSHIVQGQNQLIQQLSTNLDHLIDVQGITENSQTKEIFDPLEFDQFNELHTHTRRLVEASTDSQEISKALDNQLSELNSILIHQERLNRDSQESVLRTRMVPVQTVIARLQRSVRQTCRLTEKQVNLDVQGSEMLMDSEVLSELVDPLMHILRNAIDHGIEPKKDRPIMGKAESGLITLSFAREGNIMLVTCEDDGAGLDEKAIREVAQQRGLKTEELSTDELYRLILSSGFSTRSQATQTSGRGIGMNMVYDRILTLKGTINIRSISGQGCTFEIRLPVTLLSTHALLVREQKQRFAISERGIEQILYTGSGKIHPLGNKLTYHLDNNVYDIKTLSSLLNLPATDCRHDQRRPGTGFLVETESRTKYVVLVEEALESRDLVVKNMGHYIPKLPGIIGAAILGDGTVTYALDLPELLQQSSQLHVPIADDSNTPLEIPQLPMALVVDDSLSARRSLEQFAKDAGFEVRAALDGLDALTMVDKKIPDILLVDMEMPRMDGLELTSHLRARPETKEIPIIMISSRSTEKHHNQALASGVNVCLTKPFSEDELSGHINQLMRK